MTEKIAIKHRYTGAVLFEYQPTAEQQANGLAMRTALEAATRGGSNLRGSNLRGSDLRGADLYRADLREADLCRADLRGSDLRGSDLRGSGLGDKKLIGKRPILMIGPIGSRADYFTAYLTDAGVYLHAGCFFGSVEEFAEKCAETHGDNTHAQEYAAALELIACHARLWAPGVEATRPVEAVAKESK